MTNVLWWILCVLSSIGSYMRLLAALLLAALLLATCGHQTAASPFAVNFAEAQAGAVATSTATTAEMKQHAVMRFNSF